MSVGKYIWFLLLFWKSKGGGGGWWSSMRMRRPEKLLFIYLVAVVPLFPEEYENVELNGMWLTRHAPVTRAVVRASFGRFLVTGSFFKISILIFCMCSYICNKLFSLLVFINLLLSWLLVLPGFEKWNNGGVCSDPWQYHVLGLAWWLTGRPSEKWKSRRYHWSAQTKQTSKLLWLLPPGNKLNQRTLLLIACKFYWAKNIFATFQAFLQNYLDKLYIYYFENFPGWKGSHRKSGRIRHSLGYLARQRSACSFKGYR